MALACTTVALAWTDKDLDVLRSSNVIYAGQSYYHYIISQPIPHLPDGTITLFADEKTYYYANGYFYQKSLREKAYAAVPPPIGAVVTTIPDDYQIILVKGNLDEDNFIQEFQDGANIFEWLMKNNYLEKVTEKEGRPLDLTDPLKNKLQREHPKEYVQILKILQQPLEETYYKCHEIYYKHVLEGYKVVPPMYI